MQTHPESIRRWLIEATFISKCNFIATATSKNMSVLVVLLPTIAVYTAIYRIFVRCKRHKKKSTFTEDLVCVTEEPFVKMHSSCFNRKKVSRFKEDRGERAIAGFYAKVPVRGYAWISLEPVASASANE